LTITRYFIPLIIVLIVISFCQLMGVNRYVDQTLSQNITNGTYSVANRNNSGSDGNGYTTIQAAINAVTAGDIIYMRGGTYYEKISFPAGKQGTANNPIVWRSYPGEWAIINGGNNGAVVVFSDGPYGSCPAYWIIRNFEVTGGGRGNDDGLPGGGINLDTAHHIVFKYLYIHDNAGNAGSIDGGLVIQNETQTAEYITIKYCYLSNTTCNATGNCGTITFFADYIPDPNSVDINGARHHNEVAYNRVIGGVVGIKSKSWQILTMDHTGQGTTYQDYGDKIHHNIIEDFLGVGIEMRQDFIQCYNNITRISPAAPEDDVTGCILVGCQSYNTDREPFKAVVYNNLCLGSDLCIEHQTNGIYSPPIHPYTYLYNNIIENSTKHLESRIPFSICSNSANTFSNINMATIWFENNLFTPYNRSTSVIRIEDLNQTIDQYTTAGYATTVYNASSTTGLHKSGSSYKCNGDFAVNGSMTILNGGVGIAHPYLSGVTIPSYVGPTNPNDDVWVDGVLGMNVDWFTLQTGDNDPPWVEGSGTVIITPPEMIDIQPDKN
jgi:hypothetical protein